MDCSRVAREEVLESYLADRLSEEDRTAFEEHYFECARCFDELRMLERIRAELQGTGAGPEHAPTRWAVGWAPALGVAAAIVLTASVALWMRPSPSSESGRVAGPQSAGSTQAPEGTPPTQSTVPVASAPSLEQLARVEPPSYEPLTFRNAPGEATVLFQRGMERYRQADYQGAVVDLRAARALDPDAPHISFFLGVSHLLVGADDAAIEQLQATIALGESPYLDEAHLYLAKALLRRTDLPAAAAQLRELIARRGPHSGEAKRLLTQVETLAPP